MNKTNYWHLLLHKLIKYVNTATKSAIIDFLTRLLQKVINKRFSRSSNFCSLIRKFFDKFGYKLAYWQLILHKHKQYKIVAVERAIIHVLNRLLHVAIDKRFP